MSKIFRKTSLPTVSALLTASAIIFFCGTSFSNGPPPETNHELGKAAVIDRVLLSMIEHYYDPARFDAPRMFRATMESLQRSVAEVKFEFDEEKKKATIDVLNQQVIVDTAEMVSPWSLSRGIRRVFRFLEQHLPKKEYDLRDLEYAAANAMITTLDPHSNALPPQIYKELLTEISGHFGGLGIRITTDRRPPCRGNLTVVDVFENTPAFRAGLRRGDHIVRISGESTVNITTSEAADRLRGEPGSTVDVHIRRPGGGTHKYAIRREMIPIESIEWEMLDDQVGYVLLTAFQDNSVHELRRALQLLHARNMKGLIIDLRNNPGGSLPVAIKIVDQFISSGTIVTTAGRNGEQLDVNNATASGTEPLYPIAVLINSRSASAAEILAGALRNHGRALLVGEVTFGKGSVQGIQPISDGGAIKYTTAQYLTPGDTSIQAVGVSPDVTFVPHVVDREEMDIIPSDTRFSEADLEYHLERPGSRGGRRTGAVVGTLFVPAAERKADRNAFERCYSEKPERKPFKARYEKEFARRLVASVDGTTTEELLVRAREMVRTGNLDQSEDIIGALKKLRVDWSPAPQSKLKAEPKAQKATAKVKATAKIVGAVAPGRKVKINIKIQNDSKKPIYRLGAVTKSDNDWLDGLEFVFGKVKPGGRRTWSAVMDLPLTVAARVDEVAVKFKADSGPIPKPISIEVEIPERARPRLAYSWQFEDLGNRNGVIEPGEEVVVHVTLKNIGKGATVDAQVDLSAKPGVDVIQGRFEIGKLRPGHLAEGLFRLRVSDRFKHETAELQFSVGDWIPFRVPLNQPLLRREIDLPVSPPRPGPESASGIVAMTGDSGVALREGPSVKSREIGRTVSGASFAVDASFEDFFRVALSKERRAWIRRSDTVPAGTARPKFTPTLVEPPTIVIDGKRVRRVRTEKFTLKGQAEHPVLIRDLMVFVGDRKLLYKPNQSQSSKQQVAFEVEIPLEQGANQVMVVARHDDKAVSSLPVFIRRDAP